MKILAIFVCGVLYTAAAAPASTEGDDSQGVDILALLKNRLTCVCPGDVCVCCSAQVCLHVPVDEDIPISVTGQSGIAAFANRKKQPPLDMPPVCLNSMAPIFDVCMQIYDYQVTLRGPQMCLRSWKIKLGKRLAEDNLGCLS